MAITRDQITDYLSRYASTLTRFDASGAADLWAVPSMIVDDRFSGIFESREQMVEGLERSYPLYKRLGLGSVEYEVLEEDHLTAHLVLVHIRWTFFDSSDELLTDSSAHYLLRGETDGLRATVCIQIDDAEKIRALAAAHGIDLTALP